MLSKEDAKLNSTAVWLSLDFKTVKHRLNRITEQLEDVRCASTPQIEVGDYIDREDYTKLRKFMEDNQLNESKALAIIVNAFFRGTPTPPSSTLSPPDETL
ncbi:MAG TPA: hypothetical protein V6C90_13710 [Coleofasciculaceae cyanobacterium]